MQVGSVADDGRERLYVRAKKSYQHLSDILPLQQKAKSFYYTNFENMFEKTQLLIAFGIDLVSCLVATFTKELYGWS